MLVASNLTKRYGERTALDRLDLTVAAGEIYCLLGANGAGKTTTIHLFLDFGGPTSGTASVDGIDPGMHPEAAPALPCFTFTER